MSGSLDLAPLPGTQARALSLVGQADVSFKELAGVVEADPALTAAVLRAANSAMSSPIGRIEVAEQALVRIGIERTERIVAGAVVSGNMSGLRRAGLDLNNLWRHLVACALLADTTAWGEVRRSASFTAGLMHDIGRLAMAHTIPEQYAEVVALVRSGADAIEAEETVFGTNHVAVGLEVAEAWDLPADMAEAIGDHHYGALGALPWVVWNSRRVSWALGIGDGLETPEGVTLDPDGEDAEIVAALGGAAKLHEQINWYTGAITGSVAV
jgi:putative nucleotidyltransferase with HDIG domain